MPIGWDATTSNGDNSNTNALSGSISTATTNELIVIAVNSTSQVSSIVDTAGLNWSLRSFINTGTVGTDPRIELWTAPSPGILTADSFTIFLSASCHVEYVQGALQGVANLNAPFDTNPSLPGAVGFVASTAAASQPMSTNFAGSMLLLAYGAGGFGVPSIPAPFTQLTYDRGVYGNIALAYQLRNTQANNVQGAPNSNASGHLGILSDAILAPGPKRAVPVTAGF